MLLQVFSHLLFTILYEKWFGSYFVEPIVAGLDTNGKPYLLGSDLIGATVKADDFVVSGTCTGNFYGMCEHSTSPTLSQMSSLRHWDKLSWCLLIKMLSVDGEELCTLLPKMVL